MSIKIVCDQCKGEGFYYTGVEYYGSQETKECHYCDGKGYRVIKPPTPPRFWENKM